MLSTGARHLLKIPENALLPASLAELYDLWFAGRSYQTRFDKGWTFSPRGASQEEPYDLCLEHHTAQCWFSLDREFRVYVQCENWIPIASSFASLVETDAVLEASGAGVDKKRGLGQFPSHDEFRAQRADYLRGFQEISSDPEFTRIFQGPESLVIAARFYSDEPTIVAVEYYF